jgi:hypothetical protein
MPLLDEAVECWRPVEAKKIGTDLYLVIGTVPEDEVWAFQPGETVLCHDHVFEDGRRGLAAYARVPRDA